MSQAVAKTGAGFVAVPLIVAGGVSAAPGLSVATAGYNSDNSLVLSGGALSAAPALLVAVPGVALQYYANQPLEGFPRNATAHPATPVKPAKPQ